MGAVRRRIVTPARAAALVLALAFAVAQTPSPAVSADAAFAGTFAGDGLELRLDATVPAGRYVGTLQHGAARYPVVGDATAAGLTGSFESGGHRFEFVATLREPTLTLATGGVSYSLTRQGTAPDAPGPATRGGEPPVEFPFDLHAAFTDSGTVGTLVAPGESARGHLAGHGAGAAYHTYIVEVPAWLATLRLELHADIDLDLAAKFGSDIQSYAPRAEGGDWDHLDVGTANPTVLVIENPRAGRWFVDVIHLLGEGSIGSYELHVGGDARPPDGNDRRDVTPPAPVPWDVAADVPNPCLLLPLVPDAATAGPPPGITLGTRLVYYAASASIPGERTQLVQDVNGVWVDRATGQRWSEQDVPGPAGAGYLVAQVAYLDAQRVALSQRHYLIDPMSGQAMLMPSGAAGTVAHAGCAGDSWVHPQALAALPDMEQSGMRVIRMPYRLGDRTFDAIRIQTTTANGFTAYVYDLPSGLLLYFGSSVVGAGGLTPQPGGAAPGRGSTLLVNGWLRDVQQVDVPWRDATPPAWVAQFGEIDYQGTYTVMVPGSPTFPLPIQERVSVVARGPGWVQVSADRWMYSQQNAPISHEHVVSAHGPATVGGLWIAPDALARLTQGQVVERCSVVGVTTSVSAVSGDAVTLSEVGPLHRQDLVYDLRTGVLLGSTLVQHVGGTPNVAELRLVGGPR